MGEIVERSSTCGKDAGFPVRDSGFPTKFSTVGRPDKSTSLNLSSTLLKECNPPLTRVFPETVRRNNKPKKK